MVQAVSVRSVVFDLLRRYNASEVDGLFMEDGVHPAWLGHMLYADIMIYTFKKV